MWLPQIEQVGRDLAADLRQRHVLGEHLVERRPRPAGQEPEVEGGVRLGIEVEDQRAMSLVGQGRGQVDRRGRLADPALLVQAPRSVASWESSRRPLFCDSKSGPNRPAAMRRESKPFGHRREGELCAGGTGGWSTSVLSAWDPWWTMYVFSVSNGRFWAFLCSGGRLGRSELVPLRSGRDGRRYTERSPTKLFLVTWIPPERPRRPPLHRKDLRPMARRETRTWTSHQCHPTGCRRGGGTACSFHRVRL